MLIFAAVVPHSPLLIPEVGKENTKKLDATVASLKTLEEHLYAAQPDSVIVLTAAADAEQTSFVLNFAPIFKGSFAEFGHFNEKPEYRGDNGLSYRIKERLETRFPVKLTTVEELDYNVLVPLHCLLSHNKNAKIIPLNAANRAAADHVAFGQGVSEELIETTERVAVIASAETSHKLSKTSPAGFEPGAKRFSEKLVKLIAEKNTAELFKLKTEDLQKFGCDELNAILLLLGILAEQKCTARFLSHEAPFGIGHLVMELEL
jgi:aromatic ring-opening dioxygenase LigB subunit